MRIVFERGEILRRILVTESLIKKNPASRDVSGVRVVVTEDYRYLVRIETIREKRSLTPWLRRKGSVALDLPMRLRQGKDRNLTRQEFGRICNAAREGRNQEAVDVRIHWVSPGYIVHLGAARNFSAHRVHSEGELRHLVRRAERLFRKLNITIASASLKSLHLVRAALPSHSFVFEAERGIEVSTRTAKPLRSALVFTNISGSALAGLETDLAFWSRGIPGFRFRHVFGQLTQRRVTASLFAREWDMLIYRGHGFGSERGVAWKLADGDWPVPAGVAQVYLHSSCLAGFEVLPLASLPAPQVITPLAHLEDFDDSFMVRLFLERYKISGSVYSAVRAVQAEFPQFALIASG